MRKRFDRLTPAEYSIDDGNEAFTVNNLGNPTRRCNEAIYGFYRGGLPG
jgi:hypothetical protein